MSEKAGRVAQHKKAASNLWYSILLIFTIFTTMKWDSRIKERSFWLKKFWSKGRNMTNTSCTNRYKYEKFGTLEGRLQGHCEHPGHGDDEQADHAGPHLLLSRLLHLHNRPDVSKPSWKISSTGCTSRSTGWFQTNYCVEPGLRGRLPPLPSSSSFSSFSSPWSFLPWSFSDAYSFSQFSYFLFCCCKHFGLDNSRPHFISNKFMKTLIWEPLKPKALGFILVFHLDYQKDRKMEREKDIKMERYKDRNIER